MSEKEKCPKCGSTLTLRLGNQSHCNSCSHEWAIDRNPVATNALRRRKELTGPKRPTFDFLIGT
jgi:uncharacterized Zn ribbon protein